ncbi:L-seryl-tRNA(Sec) selenium transferase [Virgisporangium ochraceum]|uniref:L-seryl-tRNA(Sec) selenium transferase n=1 Tax=Virgisporangium ochraceum TaxID=65505 RepID=A0A8J4A071_9ACTN|nr:L-seryl-tRNA(Sec) selenium transferase [Virgisporangium ochraceum]GIJ70700.1 L-seryl-tRNA(Sec) selenium transferase [Virgisporangium ochraceum]
MPKTTVTPDPRRAVPATDTLLRDPRLLAALDRLGPTVVRRAVTAAQDRARRGEISPTDVADAAVSALPRRPTTLRPIVNATGVLVHTNLGRAVLSPAARSAVGVACGATDIEYDLSTGLRGRRASGLAAALADAVPAAEDVHVVNNNAAALVLAATALARGGEIVISRGELVEIGDAFRIPELLESTGARLREVGTTNRTSIRDYRDAVGPATAFVLKVHPSNFRVEGFTRGVGVAELAALPVPVVFDIGSGLLAPEPALPDEPDADSALRAGAALVTASGDKLLGGPQAGLLLGRRELVARLRRHPIARALRLDKLTAAALEATLRGPAPPTLASLRVPLPRLGFRADAMALRLVGHGIDARVVESWAVVGAGGAPGVRLPSRAVSLDERLAVPLRRLDPAVVGHLDGGRLLLDLRSIPEDLDETVCAAVVAAASGNGSG